jgi:hypothetical protein
MFYNTYFCVIIYADAFGSLNARIISPLPLRKLQDAEMKIMDDLMRRRGSPQIQLGINNWCTTILTMGRKTSRV